MIGFLSGKIKLIGEDFIILQTDGGVGYTVFCLGTFLAKISLKQEVEIFIETIVKEDSITLFGFQSFKELTWFQSFIKVSGIGSRTALSILSAFPINDIIFAIENAQPDFFTSIKGIGEKVATRVINEMKKEPKKNTAILTTTIVAGKVEETPQNSSISNAVGEAILVLEALGYQKPAAYKAAISIFNENPEISINDLVKLSLKKITSA
jgi:Holliday junction DNA helicase RuvA